MAVDVDRVRRRREAAGLEERVEALIDERRSQLFPRSMRLCEKDILERKIGNVA